MSKEPPAPCPPDTAARKRELGQVDEKEKGTDAQPPRKQKRVEEAKKQERVDAEMSFWLLVRGRPPKLFTINGKKRSVTVGRGSGVDVHVSSSVISNSHCELALRSKNREAVLVIKDTSRNMTGVRDARATAANKPYTELQNADTEVLNHRSQFLVPARMPPGRNDADQVEITVVFALPDMYCEWSKEGRWDYHERLGEGGLAVVYRATDMTGGLGQVAVKVSKFSNLPRASAQNRHIYALHREAQWSLQRLHNAADARYQATGAGLFARYLEDHTGFAETVVGSFDAVRERFEDPAFDWTRSLESAFASKRPYLVMEYIKGRLLQVVFEGTPPLEVPEKRAIVLGCAEALVYMGRFGVIHRDFRGCNIFCVGSGGDCRIKVIDLGFMISIAGEAQIKNPNPAVRCAWQGDPAKKLRFDWAPPEVRKRGSPNFAIPATSFDVFSFGVLVLKLLRGRTWVQEVLADEAAPLTREALQAVGTSAVGLDADLLARMVHFSSPMARPSPAEILRGAASAATMLVPSAAIAWAGAPLTSQAPQEAPAAAEGEADCYDHNPMLLSPVEEQPCLNGLQAAASSSSVPPALSVKTPNRKECDGLYLLVPGERPNGYPLWQKQGGIRWLYTSKTGKWHFGTTHERAKNFICSSGWIYHNSVHNGVWPHLMEGEWTRYNTEANQWELDPSISVTLATTSPLSIISSSHELTKKARPPVRQAPQALEDAAAATSGYVASGPAQLLPAPRSCGGAAFVSTPPVPPGLLKEQWLKATVPRTPPRCATSPGRKAAIVAPPTAPQVPRLPLPPPPPPPLAAAAPRVPQASCKARGTLAATSLAREREQLPDTAACWGATGEAAQAAQAAQTAEAAQAAQAMRERDRERVQEPAARWGATEDQDWDWERREWKRPRGSGAPQWSSAREQNGGWQAGGAACEGADGDRQRLGSRRSADDGRRDDGSGRSRCRGRSRSNGGRGCGEDLSGAEGRRHSREDATWRPSRHHTARGRSLSRSRSPGRRSGSGRHPAFA